MPIQFHRDEHVNPVIAVGLRRRAIDDARCGLSGASDSDQLAYALREGRVTFTQDDDFLRLASAGVPHAGVVYNKRGTKTIGQVIEFLVLVFTCMTEEEMRDHVEFF